jgi:hypothetical protein
MPRLHDTPGTAAPPQGPEASGGRGVKLKFNAEWHTYWLDGKQAKGVTTIAKIPDDMTLIEKRNRRMVALGLATDKSLVEQVAANPDDKGKLNDICYDAMRVAKAHAASDRGTTLHTVTERHDLGQELIDTEANVAIRNAWAAAIDAAGLTAQPDYVERIVVHPEHRLCGTLDRIMVNRDGCLVIADAKGGKNAVDYPHAIAVQLALYAHAPLLAGRLNRAGETFDFEPMPHVDKDVGYVIWMPTDDKAEVVPIDIRAGWECFNDAILPTLRWRARKDIVIRPQANLEQLLEASCPGPSNETPATAGGSDGIPETTTTGGTANPPTTTGGTRKPPRPDLSIRLAALKADQPAIATQVAARWPYKGLKAHQLDTRQALHVHLLVDRIEQGR